MELSNIKLKQVSFFVQIENCSVNKKDIIVR